MCIKGFWCSLGTQTLTLVFVPSAKSVGQNLFRLFHLVLAFFECTLHDLLEAAMSITLFIFHGTCHPSEFQTLFFPRIQQLHTHILMCQQEALMGACNGMHQNLLASIQKLRILTLWSCLANYAPSKPAENFYEKVSAQQASNHQHLNFEFLADQCYAENRMSPKKKPSS